MVRGIARALAWLVVGVIGTAVIFAGAAIAVGALVPVQPAPNLAVFKNLWDTYVSATGTWTLENDRMAFPVQTTEIVCRRERMVCTAAEAEISFGHLLFARLTEYPVISWDREMVQFRNRDPTCVDYTYTITRSTNRVIGTRTTKATADECANISKAPLNLTLSDGFKVWQLLRDEAESKVHPFMWAGLALWWVFMISRLWRAYQVGRGASTVRA